MYRWEVGTLVALTKYRVPVPKIINRIKGVKPNPLVGWAEFPCVYVASYPSD